MEFDLDGVIEHFLSAAVIALVAGWVARSWILHFLDKRTELYKSERSQEVETHKADLSRQLESYKTDLARDLEAHKLKLQHEKNEAIERLRAELRPIAYAAEVRAAELHKRRAEIIAEVYKRLVLAQVAFGDLMKPYERAGEPPRDAKARDAAQAGKEFCDYFEQNRVFLPEAACAILATIAKTLVMIWSNYTRFGYDWPKGIGPESDVKFKNQTEAWHSLDNEVPAARAELERELRTLLGDTPSKE